MLCHRSLYNNYLGFSFRKIADRGNVLGYEKMLWNFGIETIYYIFLFNKKKCNVSYFSKSETKINRFSLYMNPVENNNYKYNAQKTESLLTFQ